MTKEKNQALIETAMDAQNQDEIDRLQMNEKRPPYELYGVVAVGLIGGILITLVLIFAEGNDRPVFAGIVSTFMLAFGMPLIGKIDQNTHDTVNARLGEERREKREAARELKRINDQLIDQQERLLEMNEMLTFTKSKVQRQARVTDNVPEGAVREAAEAVAVAAVEQAKDLKSKTENE